MFKNTIQSFFLLLLILVLTSGWLSPSAIFVISLFSPNTSPSQTSTSSNTSGNSISSATNTPIKHVVAIVQEDISFDHYFGTYPNAKNHPGEPYFSASSETPTINGLNSSLLYQNPNSANPIRLDRSSLYTCSMDHNYTSEQLAYHGGASKFVEYAGPISPPS